MNHQVQNLTGLRLELEGFCIGCHSMSVAGEGRWVQDGRPAAPLKGARATSIQGVINKVDGKESRYFSFLGGLPSLKIRAKNEKFSADLNDPNAFFLNDSAEMPHGEASQFRGIRNVQKRLVYGESFGRFHLPSCSRDRYARPMPDYSSPINGYR